MTSTIDDRHPTTFASDAAPMILACDTCQLEMVLDPRPGAFRAEIVAFADAHENHPAGWSFQARRPLDCVSVEPELDGAALATQSP